MTDQQKQEFLQWVTYPALFKNKIRKAVESGLIFKALGDSTVDENVKVSLKELMPKAIKQADPIKLMKVYNKILPLAQKPVKTNIRNLQRDFIRVAPSRRAA